MKKYIIPVLVLFSLSACNNDDSDDNDCAEELCTYYCTCEHESGSIFTIPFEAESKNLARESCENLPSSSVFVNCYLE